MSKPRKSEVPHAATSRKILAELDRMSPNQFKQTLVRAGILTKQGKLTKPYRADSHLPSQRD